MKRKQAEHYMHAVQRSGRVGFLLKHIEALEGIEGEVVTLKLFTKLDMQKGVQYVKSSPLLRKSIKCFQTKQGATIQIGVCTEDGGVIPDILVYTDGFGEDIIYYVWVSDATHFNVAVAKVLLSDFTLYNITDNEAVTYMRNRQTTELPERQALKVETP